jgi:hypothetical protein
MPDIIDSRDLLTELRDLLEDPSWDYSLDPAEQANEVDEDGQPESPELRERWEEMDEDERDRAQALTDVLRELPGETVDGRNSWGCTLVHEDHFEDYARELASDIAPYGPGSETAQVLDSWPYRCIDWAQAADELQMDYATVTWEGETYYARD